MLQQVKKIEELKAEVSEISQINNLSFRTLDQGMNILNSL